MNELLGEDCDGRCDECCRHDQLGCCRVGSGRGCGPAAESAVT